MVNWIIPFAVDLQKPAPEPRFVQTLMVPGDDEAHVIQVTVNDGGEEATLTGSAMGYFTRVDGLTVRCAGTVSGNVVSIKMKSECYAYPGHLRCVVRLLTDVENELGTSLIDMDFVIRAGFGDEMIDPGEAFPTVHALATEIENFVSATNGRLNALEDAPALIQELTLAEGWENYSSSDIAPRVVRKGSICFLQGRIKNTATITLDVSNTVTIATLPNWAYPAVRAGFIEQGSSTNIFLVDIVPDGNVNLSRYRTTTYTEIAPGAMFYLTAAWLPSDATGETVDDLEALIARMEAASVGGVRYDQAQSLTTAQKTQARANIGGASAAALQPGKMYASRDAFITDVPTGKYGDLPVNRVYAVGVYAVDAEDEPYENFLGTIVTLSSQAALSSGDVQIAIGNNSKLYYRYYTSTGGGVWRDWQEAATTTDITAAVAQLISRYADLTIVEDNAGLRSSTSAFVLVKHNDSAWGDNGPCLFAASEAEYGSYVRNNGSYVVPLADQGNLPAPNANFADMLAAMKTYVGNSDLVYGNDHHMYAETCTNEIDCSTFVTAVMNGIPYQKSRYVADANTLGESVGDTLLQYDSNLGWIKLNTYNMASWFAQHKRLFEIPQSAGKSCQMLRFGDLLFGTTTEGVESERYYGIGHVGIVLGTIPGTRTVVVAEAGEFANTTINGNESTVCKTACLEFSLANIQQYFQVFARPNYGAAKVGDEGALPQFAADGKYHFAPRFTINAFVSTTTGALSSSNTWAATEAFYEVVPGKTITYTGAAKDENNVPYGCACIEYDADRNFIKVTTLTETACVLSDDTKYVRFNFGHYGDQNAKMTLARIDDFGAALDIGVNGLIQEDTSGLIINL